MPPAAAVVRKYLAGSVCSVDPFARNRRWCTWTNDINPDTAAAYHMDACEFLYKLRADGVVSDLLIFDPPYSPRQISECYAGFGRKATKEDTQNAVLYSRARNAALQILTPRAVVVSFGWNSTGMGAARGFEMVEVVLINHGAAHNDTIITVEMVDGRQARMDLEVAAA